MVAQISNPALIATELARNGYSPLPVPYGSKAPVIAGWQNLSPHEAVTRFTSGPSNVGILTRTTPVLDIDVQQEDLARQIKTEAMRRWPGALCRVGKPPKAALLLKTDAPFPKMKTKAHFLNGLKCEVEILADGQQFIGFGQHPDGHEYEWPTETAFDPARDPCTVNRDALPSITVTEARDFIAWCEATLEGAEPPKAKILDFNTAPRQFDPGNINLGSVEQQDAGSDEVREILGCIPADIAYDEWVNVLMGLHHHFGGGAVGLSIAETWSASGAKHKPGEVATKWQSFTAGSGATLSTVCAIARQYGADLSAIARHHKALEGRTTNRDPRSDAFTDKADRTKSQSIKDAPFLIKATPFVLRDPATIPPRRWLYDRHLISGFVSLTVAPGGLGKSSLALVEAVAMASDKPLLGVLPPRPLRVWVWNGEDPRDEIERRVAAIRLQYNLTDADLADSFFMDSGRDMPIQLAGEMGGGVVVAVPQIEALIAEVKRLKIDVLSIDPFVTTHAVSENDNAAINRVVSLFREVADRSGCAIELVHHSQKAAISSGSELGIAQSRGASALIDGVRSARFLVGMNADEAEKAGLDTHLGFFRVEAGKANLAPRSEKAVWRRMISVPLGNGSRLYPDGDHVGVATAWRWPDPFDGVDLETLNAVKAEIRDGEWRANEQSADWAGNAVAFVLGIEIGDFKKSERSGKETANRAKVRSLIATWLKNGELISTKKMDPKNRREAPFIEVAE